MWAKQRSDMKSAGTRARAHPVALAFLVLVLAASVGGLLARTFTAGDDMTAAVLAGAVVDLTNRARVEQGTDPLEVDQRLVVAAQHKADDMATRGYFAHTSPDGKTPWYWLAGAGYRFTYAGENLAVNFSESESVVRAWMNSPGHKANLLNPNFTQIGIATSTGIYKGKPAVFVVQMFGRPSLLSAWSSAVRTVAQNELRTTSRQLAGVGGTLFTDEISITGAADMRVTYGALSAVLFIVIAGLVFVVRHRAKETSRLHQKGA